MELLNLINFGPGISKFEPKKDSTIPIIIVSPETITNLSTPVKEKVEYQKVEEEIVVPKITIHDDTGEHFYKNYEEYYEYLEKKRLSTYDYSPSFGLSQLFVLILGLFVVFSVGNTILNSSKIDYGDSPGYSLINIAIVTMTLLVIIAGMAGIILRIFTQY